MKTNSLSHVGVLGMKWGRRKAQDSSRGSPSTRVKNISKEKISNVKRNLKVVGLVGGVVGGTVGTIAMVKLMNKRDRKRAQIEVAKFAKNLKDKRTAKNVIYLPAHMSKPRKPYLESNKYKSSLKKMAEMDAVAGQLRRGEGRPRGEVTIRTLQEMERVADILRNGGLA